MTYTVLNAHAEDVAATLPAPLGKWALQLDTTRPEQPEMTLEHGARDIIVPAHGLLLFAAVAGERTHERAFSP
ncbi:hypothetical protein RAA17_12560 [Komagataeibacter rhaeticus]|nr:hypothetical protein [Komagataeibacter rhaeticus]